MTQVNLTLNDDIVKEVVLGNRETEVKIHFKMWLMDNGVKLSM